MLDFSHDDNYYMQIPDIKATDVIIGHCFPCEKERNN